MIQEKTFDTGEVILSYGEGPDNGPPLILLPGVSGNWKYLSPIIRATENNWKIYALNQRGHSTSGKTPGHYFLKDYASDLTCFIKEKTSEPPVLFGHSLGGMVSIMVAGAMKDKVRALIVGDSLQNIDSKKTFEIFKNNKDLKAAFKNIHDLTSKKHTHLEIAEKLSGGVIIAENRLYAKHLLGFDPEAMRVWIEASNSYDSYLKMHEDYDCARLYKEMSCPVCLVQADPSQGAILTDDDIDYVSKVHADICVIRLPGLAHGLGIDKGHTDWIQGPLVAFLYSLR